MKLIFKNTCLKTILVLSAIFACVPLFTACGESAKPVQEDDDPDSSSSTKGKGSSSSVTITSGAITDAADIDLDKYDPGTIGKVVDERNGQTYNVVKVGIYSWTFDNINIKLTDLKSTCYAYDDELCPKYGRLYMANNADRACPEGFDIPKISEWRYLLNEDIDLNLTYAGNCVKKDTLECSGLDTTVIYLARNDSAVSFDIDENIYREKVTKNGFYSLRCVKSETIVDKFSDLPKCGNKSQLPTLYVIERDTSYYCEDGVWEASSYKGCSSSEEGAKHVYNKELLYICKDGKWGQATINDIGEECDQNNFEKEYILNNIRYACTDTGWYELPYPASELGQCLESGIGKIAKTKSGMNYYCDRTGWRFARIQEVYGNCDSTSRNKIVTFEDVEYICEKNNWILYKNSVEYDIGLCTEKNLGEVSLKLNKVQKCEKNGWASIDPGDYLPYCTEKNKYDTLRIGSNLWYCNDRRTWQNTPTFVFDDGSFHFCREDSLGYVIEIEGDTSYYCTMSSGTVYTWKRTPRLFAMLGSCPNDTEFVVVTDTLKYTCRKGSWYESEAEPSDLLGECDKNTATVKDTIYKGQHYVCDTSSHRYKWIALTEMEDTYGYCRAGIADSVIMLQDSTLRICSKDIFKGYIWADYSWVDQMKKTTPCTEELAGTLAFNGINHSICEYKFGNYNWIRNPIDTITDERTGYKYRITEIGGKQWLSDDLIYYYDDYQFSNTTFSDVQSNVTEAPSSKQPKHLLYSWHAAMALEPASDSARSGITFKNNYQGICMDGWHIPSLTEWEEMAGLIYKRSGTENSSAKGGMLFGEDNIFGTAGYSGDPFAINIDGIGYDSVYYDNGLKAVNVNVKKIMYYWLPTEYSATKGSYVGIQASGLVTGKTTLKTNAMSVRCVKD